MMGAQMVDAATKRLGIPDSLVSFLTEDPNRDASHRARPSTKDEIEKTLGAAVAALGEGDQLFILLIGHGSGQGAESRFNVPGPDPSAADFSRILGRAGSHTVIFVDATSASGDVIPVLSAPGRILITATKSAMERNESVFAQHFVAAFSSDGADVDKDGRVSMLEAFDYAKREVARFYENDNRLQTEHAQLDDNADGKGSSEPSAKGPDGILARSTFLAPSRIVAAQTSNDPKLVALYNERQAIEARIDALKGRKGTLDSASYRRQLELLITDLAVKSADIRKLEAKKP
jgi:hypothetical protein